MGRSLIPGLVLTLGSTGLAAPWQAWSAETPSPLPIPKVQANGGIGFQSQSSGSANTISGYWFAPLKRNAKGDLLFLDFSGNLNIGGAAPQANDVNVGASMRLGYRWLKPNQRWIYGVNAGIDTRPAYNTYTWQAGVGAEALSRSLEMRLNGYIPFANTNDLYQSGWSNASLSIDRLILDGYNRYVVAVGGVDAEAGIPLKRWKNASLWTYAGYYYQYGDYLTGSSGVRARAEMRVGSQLALGATVSYDSLFQTQANGYIRYGSRPINGRPKEAIDQAETNFLALLGLPVERQIDVRLDSAQVNLPGTTAINPATGQPWVVRCAGTTSGNYQVNCAYANALAAIQAGTSDAVLLANGTTSTNLGGLVGANLRLPAGTSLTNGSNAPTLSTQFGGANLATIFGTSTGSAPSFSNGVIGIGSNTTVAGLSFTNASITNYSTSNVLIANNNFTGSYSTTPGLNTYNQNALPAISLAGVTNATITGNTITNPNIQSYTSAIGTSDDGGTEPVCGREDRTGTTYQAGICLSGNAIRIGNSQSGSASSGLTITNNTISGALDEAIRLDNPNGTVLIKGNTITGMRMGPDTNIGTAIFVRQNTGESVITVENNFVNGNIGGRNLIAKGGIVSSGTFTATTNNVDNVIDGLEVGLCRGDATFPRAADKYGDGLIGNCSASSPAKMTYYARNNNLAPSSNATSATVEQFDEDGIDFNIGSYGVFNAVVENNTVAITSDRNNAFTVDYRGNNNTTTTMSGNNFTSTEEPISIEVQTAAGLSTYGQGFATINNNTLRNSGTANKLIELTSVARNLSSANPNPPNYYLTALNPSYDSSLYNYKTENFKTSNNDYPIFFVNGTKVLPSP